MAVVIGTILMITLSGKEKNTFTNEKINLQINTFSCHDSLFHSGDIIFRDGRGLISNAFKKFSQTDSRYSHAGIIHKENGKTFVLHLIDSRDDNNMKKETLNEFCSGIRSNGFAVYRTNLDGNKIDSIAKFFYSKNIKFDTDFSLMTDDKMYCTELIYKVLILVSGDVNFLPLTTISGIKYEACDNIYLSSHLKKIYSFDYSF